MNKIHSADSTTIAYEKIGIGMPLLLIHGGYVDHTHWNAVLPLLAQYFTVYAMDRRGHGESDPYRQGHSLESDVEDALAVLDTIHQPTFILGHSASAYIALEAAARSPFASKLVLYEPPVLGTSLNLPAYREELTRCLVADDRACLVTIVINDIVGKATGREMPPPAMAAMLQSPFGQILLRNAHAFPIELESYAAYHFDVERFRTFRLPTLFLLGSDSPPFNRIVTDQLHAVLPHSQVIMLEGQEHGAMTSASDLFARVLRMHLIPI
jgi:pimeloyl-ACP methyl ester carboxylesterase